MGVKLDLLTSRKGRWPRAFENTVLRKIFGPRWKAMTGDWTELHSEAFHDCAFVFLTKH